jgi:HrpA-like RNA helicase
MADIEFSSTLPVEEFRDELMIQIRENQIIICVGETGTLLPIQVCSVHKFIIHQEVEKQQKFHSFSWIRIS